MSKDACHISIIKCVSETMIKVKILSLIVIYYAIRYDFLQCYT